jgi:hypothetical protein
MRLLAARISKTAIPWRTRGPDARRGQLRFVAGVWPAIVNAVRRRGALLVSWMHSVTVGMAGNNESSPAGEVLSWCYGCTVLQSGWLAIVNPVRQRGALMVLWMHSVTVGMAGDSESNQAGMTGVVSTVGQAATRDSTTRSRYGSWGEPRLVRLDGSSTGQMSFSTGGATLLAGGRYGSPSSSTRQAVSRRLPTNNGFCGDLQRLVAPTLPERQGSAA